MAKKHSNQNGQPDTRVLPVEWFTPQPFWPEVKETAEIVTQKEIERIRYVKLGIGIFDHRAPGGSVGIRRDCGHGGVDR
jgi:hypothetical protein